MSLDDWRTLVEPATDEEAVFYARDWHGGQDTQMYALSSTGQVTDFPALVKEIEESLIAAEKVLDDPEGPAIAEREDDIFELAALGLWAEQAQVGMTAMEAGPSEQAMMSKVEGRRVVDRVSRGGYKAVTKARPNFSAKQAAELLVISDADAKKVFERIQDGGGAQSVLRDISDIIDGFGVEAWQGEGEHSTDEPAVALYVNTGDIYNATVIYDVKAGNYLVTDLGSYIEDRRRDELELANTEKSLPGGNVGGTVGVSPGGDESMYHPTAALAVENTRERR